MAGIPVEELFEDVRDYTRSAEAILEQVEDGHLIPVRSSGLNGLRPALYNRYLVNKTKNDKKAVQREIDLLIEPPLSSSFYKKHTVQFEKDRSMILALQEWLEFHPDPDALTMVSMNERSFEIFFQEKALKESGLRVAKNLGIKEEQLRFYRTIEPLALSSASNRPGPILIIENRDPYISLRNLLVQKHTQILGSFVQTVAYGSGYRIHDSLQDMLCFGAPYILESLSYGLYYWGDLDYEGIHIYEKLVERYPHIQIVPWLPGYRAMLAKGRNVPLPFYKEKQKYADGRLFFSFFDETFVLEAKAILEAGRYIPQEILSQNDYCMGSSVLFNRQSSAPQDTGLDEAGKTERDEEGDE